MSTQMIVRIDPELKTKAVNFARAEGKNASEVIRELLEAYVRDRDIGSYVDELWKRTGKKLKSGGIGDKEIKRAIAAVRAEKK